ncbi:MAG: NAD(P)-dependent oxidoreductase [Gemmatimonadota bacterium]|nr:NAD(P)-dependent oxidoreductase [Gemmatimonadota bacterium]
MLVTGATGFIGSHLIDRLLERGDEVTAFARPTADSSYLAAKGVQVITGDVRSQREVGNAVGGSEIVYHLARAKGHGARSMAEVQAVNIDGTSNIARAATRAGAERIVYASSAAVYGSRPGPEAVGENSILNPDSAYSRSKAEAEAALREHAQVAFVIARITAVLGPGCRSWMPIFRSVAARRLRLIGQGKTRHHPADVADIVDGLILCGTMPLTSGRTYNLAGPEAITIADMVRAIAAALHAEVDLPRFIPAGPIELYLWLNRIAGRVAGVKLPRVDSIAFLTSDRVLDISRARTELGYVPRITVSQAITRTAERGRSEGLL